MTQKIKIMKGEDRLREQDIAEEEHISNLAEKNHGEKLKIRRLENG